ncbi:hypothetical protein ACLOJK_014171 [Asimina triloba]
MIILGIPWDVDTDGLRQYMSQFGELADVMVMKDRASGRSRGFGYVTFSSSEDAKKALSAQHSFKGRILEVKVATPKARSFALTPPVLVCPCKQEEMAPVAKKTTRIFVARIPSSVTGEDFHRFRIVI